MAKCGYLMLSGVIVDKVTSDIDFADKAVV